VKTLGFEHLKDMYCDDPDFKEAYEACANPVLRDRSQWAEYMIQEGLLFKGNQLCIPKCLMRDNLLKEKHTGGLAGHFGHDKTFAQLSSSYYWPGMRTKVIKFVNIYDFKEAYEACANPVLRDRSQWAEYMIQEGLLFKGNQLCIPKCLMRDNLLKEKHTGGLAGHFGHDKTFAQLSSSYYWPGMRTKVIKFVNIYDFKEAYEACANPVLRDRSQWAEYMIQEGLLFKGNQLCIPKCLMRDNLLKEKHTGGLAGHFGHDKTFAQLSSSYYWPGMRTKVIKFVNIYDFKEAYEACANPVLRDRSQWAEYMIQEGLLFKGNQLCIPKCLMRDNLLKEKHTGGLAGHFGHDKTFAQLSSSYYWPGMRTKVIKFVNIYDFKEAYKACANPCAKR
jgi:hypothetical protein